MTPQEFNTLTEGVSAPIWSRVLTPGFSVERVKAWFSGEAPIPEIVIEQVRYFMSVIEHEKLRLVEEFHDRGTTDAYFVIYLNNEDFRIYDPQMYRLLGDYGLQNHFYWSLTTALRGIGCWLTRVPFQSDSYKAWLRETRLSPSPANLELWAKLHHSPYRLNQVGLATESPADQKNPQFPTSCLFASTECAEPSAAQNAFRQILIQQARAIFRQGTARYPDQATS